METTVPEPEAKPKADSEPAEPPAEADESGSAEVHASGENGDEAFAKFAPAGEERAGWFRRAALATGRFIGHEWTVAAFVSVVLAALMTWPTLQYPSYTIPQDVWDPTLESWMVAWGGHGVLTNITHLFDANAFYPESLSYAFTDTLLGYAPIGMMGSGFAAAIVRYNILYVLLHALAFFGMYVLARQLGSGKTGAAVAGAAFAYAPWRLAQAGHMHVLSTGGIALSLAMLARGHGFSLKDGYQPEKAKWGWALAGWLVAAWQISLGFGIGLPFGYVVGGISLVALIMLIVRRVRSGPFPFGWKLITANVIGVLLFGITTVGLASVYLKVAELHPYAVRSEAEVGMFSPPFRGFFIAPETDRLWGDAHEAARATLPWSPEMTMLPGFVLYGLAIAGLIMSIWRLRQRLWLFAGAVTSIFLAMGTATFGQGRPGYLTLYDILPGWDALRTSGRLVVWTTLLLALLAAGAVSAFVEQVKLLPRVQVTGRPHPLARAAMLLPVLLILIEGLNTTPHPVVPQPPASLTVAEAPLLVLPSDQLRDEHVMVWLTRDFPKMVNGGSGFTPNVTNQVREATKSFPDQASVDLLRSLGVKTVVVLRAQSVGTPYEAALSNDGSEFGLKREEYQDAVVFRIAP